MTTQKPSPPRFPNLERLETMVGGLLRAGVFASSLLMAAGIILSILHHPAYLHDPATLAGLTQPGAAFPGSLRELGQELAQGRGRAVTTLGLILLIATPALRVLVSVIAFVIERNWRYVAITSCVLLVLIVSMMLGRVE